MELDEGGGFEENGALAEAMSRSMAWLDCVLEPSRMGLSPTSEGRDARQRGLDAALGDVLDLYREGGHGALGDAIETVVNLVERLRASVRQWAFGTEADAELMELARATRAAMDAIGVAPDADAVPDGL